MSDDAKPSADHDVISDPRPIRRERPAPGFAACYHGEESGGAPVFIGGAGRSGTTLLRACLGAHRRLHARHEFKLMPEIVELREKFGRFAEIMRGYSLSQVEIDAAFGRLILRLLGPAWTEARTAAGPGVRIVEKTPHNAVAFATLGRMLPRAQFIHVIRDGRDVVRSLLEQKWGDNAGNPVPYTESVAAASRYWYQVLHHESASVGLAPWMHSRVMELRYEWLVSDPEQALRAVCEFLGEDYDARMLDPDARAQVIAGEPTESSTAAVTRPITPDSIGRWRDMDPDDLAGFDDTAANALYALGYEYQTDWRTTRAITRTERFFVGYAVRPEALHRVGAPNPVTEDDIETLNQAVGQEEAQHATT